MVAITGYSSYIIDSSYKVQRNNILNMNKKLGGSLFVIDGLKHDYCIKESVECLQAMCDEVVILDAGSEDGTLELLKSLENKKTKIVSLPRTGWQQNRGKEKLAHFTNVAKSLLCTEWNFNLQADEVVHESCFAAIRQAIDTDNEGFFCTRINLWGNSQHQLSVSSDRLPVGNKIIRLAKTKYYSYGDGEGIYAPASWDYLSKIRIYHAGFVRDAKVHIGKIENMLVGVFGMEMDKGVIAMGNKFDPWVSFNKEDVIPIEEPLPTFLQEWAKKRDETNGVQM